MNFIHVLSYLILVASSLTFLVCHIFIEMCVCVWCIDSITTTQNIFDVIEKKSSTMGSDWNTYLVEKKIQTFFLLYSLGKNAWLDYGGKTIIIKISNVHKASHKIYERRDIVKHWIINLMLWDAFSSIIIIVMCVCICVCVWDQQHVVA